VPVTDGVTVFIAVPCVNENVFGEYEIDGADRPDVVIGDGGRDASEVGVSSSPNQLMGFIIAKSHSNESYEIMTLSPLPSSSSRADDGGVCTMAAESDIVIINITKNNDLNIIDCELRYSADWAMIGVGRFL
tara:strand:- start:1069 stop:1464 length:396 start_codon:yes stop_codon:yes gene_type:complete